MEEVDVALLKGRRAVQPPGPSVRSRIHGWQQEEEVHSGRGRGREAVTVAVAVAVTQAETERKRETSRRMNDGVVAEEGETGRR